MEFSKKILLIIILIVTKKQSFNLSLEDTFLEKPQGEEGQIVSLRCLMVKHCIPVQSFKY